MVAKESKITWTQLAFFVSGILLVLGYIVVDNKAQDRQIMINTNRLTAIESKPVIDAKDDLEELQAEIILLNQQQKVLESKLNMLIAIATDTNKKIDRHMQESIKKAEQRK